MNLYKEIASKINPTAEPVQEEERMKRQNAAALLTSIFTVFCFSFTPLAHAKLTAESIKGMTQGEFAIALLKEAGALKNIGTSGDAEDAIDYLRSIGIAPSTGWDVDKVVDDEFLRSLLGDDASGTTEELLQKIQSLVDTAVANAEVQSNVFPVAGASGSSPA